MSELLRHNAAFNFSAMTIFCGDGKYFTRDLLPTMQCLCTDHNPAVRQTMAASFHEVREPTLSIITPLHYDTTPINSL